MLLCYLNAFKVSHCAHNKLQAICNIPPLLPLPPSLVSSKAALLLLIHFSPATVRCTVFMEYMTSNGPDVFTVSQFLFSLCKHLSQQDSAVDKNMDCEVQCPSEEPNLDTY